MSKRKRKQRRLAQRKKVQQRFKKRVSEGKSGLTGGKKGSGLAGSPGSTISNYRNQQRQQVTDAAMQRTLNTNAMVARDNRMYGNTFPSGSIGISDAGRRQAAANRASAARAKSAASARSAAEARRKSAENARRIASERAAAEAARKAEAERKRKAEIARKAEEKRQRMFNPKRLENDLGITNAQAFSTVTTANAVAPAGGISSWYNQGRLPNEARMSIRDLASNDLRQQQQTGKFNPNRKLNLASYARAESNPFRGMPGYGTITGQGQVPGGFQTGPTPSVRQAIERPLKFGLKTLSLLKNPKLAIAGALMTPTALADGTLTGNQAVANKLKAGGLNIGGSSSETEGGGEGASRTSRTLGNRLLGGVDAIMRDTTDFDRLGVGKPASFGLGNTTAGKVLNAAANETGTINRFRTETDNFKNLANFNNLPNADKVKTAQSVLKFTNDSQAAQALGESLGLGKDFKTKINNLAGDLQERAKGVTADRDSLYGVTSQFAKDIGTDPDLEPLNKFLTATATNNLGESGKENVFGGLNREMARDIKAAFQDDSPTTQGLSKEERGFVGSAGNRLLSGKATDALREASYGFGNKPAVNAGVSEGAPMNFTDIINTGLALKNNLGGDTLAAKRFDEAKRLITPSGPTAGSLIRGTLPRFGGGRRSGSPVSLFGGGGGSTTTATPAATPVQQVTEELLPIQQQQSGQDPTALADIAQQAYTSALNSYGIDPNFFARINRRRFNTQPNSFRRSFIRRYF